MAYRYSRKKNPDTGLWPFRNRMAGCICNHCGKVITGTEPRPGEVKAWQRIAGQSCNWHLACAIAIGKIVNRQAYERILRENPDLERVELPPVAPAPYPAPMPMPPVEPAEDFGAEDPEVDIDVPEVTPDPEPPAPPAPVLPPWMAGFAEAILPFIEGKINGKLDKPAVLDLINRHAVKREVVEVHDKRNGEVRVLEGRHHPMFRRLLETIAMGFHPMLIGPCASGKTTAVRNAAKALNYTLYMQGPVATKYDLLGYLDAGGTYHPTPFMRWFTSETPAILLWDEYDANESSAILDTNAALENRICNFPFSAEPVEIGNPASVAVACANTWGLGASDDFVGRCRQDAAALNRWVQLNWDYDVEMERAIAHNDKWVARVQSLRENARRKGLQVVISPRASYRGAVMLAAGWSQAEVEKIEVRKSMSDTDWRAIQ